MSSFEGKIITLDNIQFRCTKQTKGGRLILDPIHRIEPAKANQKIARGLRREQERRREKVRAREAKASAASRAGQAEREEIQKALDEGQELRERIERLTSTEEATNGTQ